MAGFCWAVPPCGICAVDMSSAWLVFHTCTTACMLCRWDDPDDLASKAHGYIQSNWGAAYQLNRPKAWNKPH